MKLLKSVSRPDSGTFNPGNICNLACVTCGPSASSRWKHECGLPIPKGNPVDLDLGILEDAKNLKSIVIGGGEPVLNFSTETFLKNANPEQDILVHFNGTVLPGPDFLTASSRFENIRYCFSLDGVGDRFEYLRWPARWSQVVKNILFLVDTAPDNIQFSVNTTISQLNKLYYTEVVDWVTEYIPQNRSGKKTQVTYNQAGDILTRQYLDNLDKKRKTDWKLLFPLAIIPN